MHIDSQLVSSYQAAAMKGACVRGLVRARVHLKHFVFDFVRCVTAPDSSCPAVVGAKCVPTVSVGPIASAAKVPRVAATTPLATAVAYVETVGNGSSERVLLVLATPLDRLPVV